MGLDMYLEVNKYVSGWGHGGESTQVFEEITAKIGLTPISDAPYVEVYMPVLYWRKANQIHRWFVKNVQNDVDNCERHSVSREDLRNLRDDCQAAIVAPDPTKILPTQSGFFFGSTEYDDWYMRGLRDTITGIDQVLEQYPDDGFAYRSSW